MTLDLIRRDARPGRMAPLATLPVFLVLDGKRAVVAGGDAAAAWKAELLSAAGARVDVYAEESSEEMRTLAAEPPRGAIVVHPRRWTPQDFAGAAVAVGAFEHDGQAARFAEDARAARVPVNLVDRPALSDFTLGAVVNRSPLVIGIGTDGAAPVFAQAIRAKLETLLPIGFSTWAAAAQRWRAAVTAAGLSSLARRVFWQRFTAHAMAHVEREPEDADFDCLITGIKDQNAAPGSVTTVHAASGDPDLLTLRAVRALQSADIILFDERVSHAMLDFARREARKLLVRRSSVGGPDDLSELMRGLAESGKHVVRLTGYAALDASPGQAAEQPASATDSAAPAASAGRNGAVA